MPGDICAGSWNEGVGEHVRARFHLLASEPVKLRTEDPHRTKKACFFCRLAWFKERTLRMCDPAV